MSTAPLGRLQRVQLREAWPNEAQNFTPWLAQPENLSLLGEAIGCDLEPHAEEHSVGPFRAARQGVARGGGGEVVPAPARVGVEQQAALVLTLQRPD